MEVASNSGGSLTEDEQQNMLAYLSERDGNLQSLLGDIQNGKASHDQHALLQRYALELNQNHPSTAAHYSYFWKPVLHDFTSAEDGQERLDIWHAMREKRATTEQQTKWSDFMEKATAGKAHLIRECIELACGDAEFLDIPTIPRLLSDKERPPPSVAQVQEFDAMVAECRDLSSGDAKNFACWTAKVPIPGRVSRMKMWLPKRTSKKFVHNGTKDFVHARLPTYQERYRGSLNQGLEQYLFVGVLPVGLSIDQLSQLALKGKRNKFEVADLPNFEGWAMVVCCVDETAVDHPSVKGDTIKGQIHYDALQLSDENVVPSPTDGRHVFFFEDYCPVSIDVGQARKSTAAKNIQAEIQGLLDSRNSPVEATVASPKDNTADANARGDLKERKYAHSVDERAWRYAPKGLEIVSLISLFVLQHDAERRMSRDPDLTMISLLPALIKQQLPGAATADYPSNIQEQFFDRDLVLHAISVPEDHENRIEIEYPGAAGSRWETGRAVLCMHMRRELERHGLKFTVKELLYIHSRLEELKDLNPNASEVTNFFVDLRQALDVEKYIHGANNPYWKAVDITRCYIRAVQAPREYAVPHKSTELIGPAPHVTHDQVIELLATTTVNTLREISQLSLDHTLNEFRNLGVFAMPGSVDQIFERLGSRLDVESGNEAIRDLCRYLLVCMNEGRRKEGMRIDKVANFLETVTSGLFTDASRRNGDLTNSTRGGVLAKGSAQILAGFDRHPEKNVIGGGEVLSSAQNPADEPGGDVSMGDAALESTQIPADEPAGDVTMVDEARGAAQASGSDGTLSSDRMLELDQSHRALIQWLREIKGKNPATYVDILKVVDGEEP